MNVQDIRKITKYQGVTLGKLGKIELVRTLQHEEGNFDCFARAYEDDCDQLDCLWRHDCLTLSIRGSNDN